MVEGPANGDWTMTSSGDLRRGPSGSVGAWLRARSAGPIRPNSVLFHAPSFAFQAPGGGENQLVQTGRHLEDLGVPVRLFDPWTDRIDRFRLIHLFGMSREGLELARRARIRGTPVVLSPICWYQPRALWALERRPTRKLGGIATWALRRAFPRLPGWRRELLNVADAILPNSAAEGRQLQSLFGIESARVTVVPNGVCPSFAMASPERFLERYGERDFVLYVGRIEPRKNVLGLIRAVRPLGLPLVVMGSVPPESHHYGVLCRKAGDGQVRWIASVDHHDPLLASAYAAARVFALPSWFETPGLAALEAGLAGAAVVITPFGSTREYFGELAEYAPPDRVAKIRAAVTRGWERGADPSLARRIASNYLWTNTAQTTLEVYDQVSR